MVCRQCLFFFSSRRRHTRFDCDWSSDVCSSDLLLLLRGDHRRVRQRAARNGAAFRSPRQRDRGRTCHRVGRRRARSVGERALRLGRSEERRVGKECRSRWATDRFKKRDVKWYVGSVCFFFQAEDGIRDLTVTGVQTCALPIYYFFSEATIDEFGNELLGTERPSDRPDNATVGGRATVSVGGVLDLSVSALYGWDTLPAIVVDEDLLFIANTFAESRANGEPFPLTDEDVLDAIQRIREAVDQGRKIAKGTY